MIEILTEHNARGKEKTVNEKRNLPQQENFFRTLLELWFVDLLT